MREDHRTPMPSFPTKSARELMDTEFDTRWMARDAIGPAARATLASILDRFVADGGPIAVETLAVTAALSSLHVDAALTELDTADLVVVRDGRVVLAYPFASAPTGFVVRLASGAERHSCCAIDALGIAPMLGERILVRAACHHCGERLEIPVDPEGPLGVPDVMAWVGRRDELRAKACDGL